MWKPTFYDVYPVLYSLFSNLACLAKKKETRDDPNIAFAITFEELGSVFTGLGIDLEKVTPFKPAVSSYKAAHGFAQAGGVIGAVKYILKDEQLNAMQVTNLDTKNVSMEGSGMVGVPGYSSRLFDVLSQNNINIILITQASSVHTMCIAIPESDAAKAKKAADELFAYEISLGKVDPLKVEKGFSIISLVGDDLKNQSGASGRMFDALGREGINIRAIAQGSSEKNVSTVLHTEDVKAAIRAIHKEFFSGKGRRINLFFAGCGTVGSALIDMINRQHEMLEFYMGNNTPDRQNFIKDNLREDVIMEDIINTGTETEE